MPATPTYLLTLAPPNEAVVRETFHGELHEAVGHAQVMIARHCAAGGRPYGVAVHATTLLGYVAVDGYFESID
jgi:hypothetical protein